jgi:RNA polymerase sigma-70 factor, ECF subfamily
MNALRNGIKDMMDNVEQELELIHKILDGDQQALSLFYDTYAGDLYAFIYHLVNDGNRQNAEDIWQESLMAAYNGLGSFRGNSRLFTWLCAIARFKVMAFYRRSGRSQAEPLETPWEQIGLMMDKSLIPENLISRREVKTHVVEVMQLLPPEYRQVLLARYVDGKSVSEVSNLIGRSYKACESLLARARVRFLEIYQKSGGEFDD